MGVLGQAHPGVQHPGGSRVLLRETGWRSPRAATFVFALREKKGLRSRPQFCLSVFCVWGEPNPFCSSDDLQNSASVRRMDTQLPHVVVVSMPTPHDMFPAKKSYLLPSL